MNGYQGHFVPTPDGRDDIPLAFADFIACENPDWMSPNGAGIFLLYSAPGWVEDSRYTEALLARFKEKAKTDDGIDDEDIALAERWVAEFRNTYGLSARFHFEE